MSAIFTGEMEQIASEISYLKLTEEKRLELGKEMGIPPRMLNGIEDLARFTERDELARKVKALAGMVKYWFEYNREASFKKLADILTKMKMPLRYTQPDKQKQHAFFGILNQKTKERYRDAREIQRNAAAASSSGITIN